MATRGGHLDVVNRLLDCKQIDVNVRSKVSGIVDCATSYLSSPALFTIFFCDVFFYSNFVDGKK